MELLEDKNGLYYERVSTFHDAQSESLENQRALCESYLRRHPEIRLAEPIDSYSERISGKSDERPRFQAMLKRLSRGDIDYLLVKDLKRLSRSSEVSAALRNLAKRFKFKIILLSTSQIYDPNADETRMMYGFEALVNEEVVFRQSEYGRIAHKQKCEAKRLNRNNVTFGYKWDADKKDIIVDEDAAEIVRTLFDKYVFQDAGIKDLRKYLSALGLHYSSQTVTKWMQETAYIGVFHLNKKGSELGVGSGQKTRRYFRPKEEWVAVERPDLAIVDEGIFKLAQQIRESRQRLYKEDKNGIAQARFRGKHLFASKVFCAECGFPYVHGYADRKSEVAIYKDSFASRNRNAAEKCRNERFRRIYEEDLIKITLTAINGMIQESEGCFNLLLSVLEEVIRNENNYNSQISTKKKELKKLIAQADKTKEAYIEAPGALKAALAKDYEVMDERITQVKSEIVKLQENMQGEDSIKLQIERIRDAVLQLKGKEIDTLDRKMVETFIYRIEVHMDGQINVHLNSDFIYNSRLDDMKKGNSKKGSSFILHKMTEYRYDRKLYLQGIEKVILNHINGHICDTELMLFSYTLEGRTGAKGGGVNYIVVAGLYLRN